MVRTPSNLCVLADPYLRAYQVSALEHVVATTNVEIPLVVVADPEPEATDHQTAAAANGTLGVAAVRTFLDRLDQDGAWAAVYVEKKLAELGGESAATTEYRHVTDVDCFDTAEIEYVRPIEDGHWTELPAETVDRIQQCCDLAVRYGFGLLRGDVLTATPFGVLSFHPADIRQYRGLGAPQAWLDDRDRMGMTLQRLTEDIDGGEIVAYRETDVSDCATLWEVFAALRALQPLLLADGITNLRDPAFEPTVPDSLGPYYSTTKRRQPSFAARTLLKNTTGRLTRRLDVSSLR